VEYNGQRELKYHFFSSFTGIKTKMLLIIFLGLIATLTSVSGDCDVGTQGVKYVDFTKVGITVLGGFLKQAVFKALLRFVFHLCFH